ncbi:32712_t:CDS:2 [Racocetra persica]|uniref:32712_t:CDS:1 n=1 Tax=Racocetra persica TaxID=160502 RepID=A0ACA9KBY5_9GLOM|nr:32712_t:CDS:2 [Racocetra persica]
MVLVLNFLQAEFQSIFLANVKSCLHTHRSAQGSKQFTYKCTYKEQDGYQKIGYIFAHPAWGEKTTKTGSEVRVITEKKNLEIQQMLKTELVFLWKEQTTNEEYNEEVYTWTYWIKIVH